MPRFHVIDKACLYTFVQGNIWKLPATQLASQTKKDEQSKSLTKHKKPNNLLGKPSQVKLFKNNPAVKLNAVT